MMMIKVTITQADNTSIVIEIPYITGTTAPVIQVTTITEPTLEPVAPVIAEPTIEWHSMVLPEPVVEPVVAPIAEPVMNYSDTHAHTKCVQFKTPITVIALTGLEPAIEPVLEFALSD